MRESRLVQEAKRLIRLKSVTTDSNDLLARHVGTLLQEAGFRVLYETRREKGILFSNVIGIKGKGRNPLIFMTHLDTVPPGPLALWTKTGKDPWNPVVRGNRIYGLGSADTKLDILPKILASQNIPEKQMKRPLLIVGTFGEERGLMGARLFCKKRKGLKGIAFVSEPSGLRWVHEHRGYVVLELSIPLKGKRSSYAGKTYHVKAIGKSAHSSVPHRGRNAIRLLFDFLKRMPDIAVLSIQGGSSPNQVPAEAEATIVTERKIPFHPFIRVKRVKGPRRGIVIPWNAILDIFLAVDQGVRRWAHSMTSNVGWIGVEGKSLKILIDFRIHPKDKNERVILFFERLMQKSLKRHGLRVRFRIERDGPSLSLSPRSAIVNLTRLASRDAGIPFRLVRKPSCTEAGYLLRHGIPALVFGPGKSIGNIHCPNEYNDLRQLEKALQVYRVLIEHYCIGRRHGSHPKR